MSDICFKVDNKYLYLEQKLVVFDVPIFFICKDICDLRYSVLCTDSQKVSYLIVQNNDLDIAEMLENKITMRELLLSGGSAWRVLAGDEMADDEVIPVPLTELTTDDLPVEGAFFELISPQIEKYIEVLKASAQGILSINIFDWRENIINSINSITNEYNHESGDYDAFVGEYSDFSTKKQFVNSVSRKHFVIPADIHSADTFLADIYLNNMVNWDRRICYG